MNGKEKGLRIKLTARDYVILALVPLIAAALYIVITLVMSQPVLRYNPDYFTNDYTTRYDSPGAVVFDLERALRSGDAALMAELEGLRRPKTFSTNPNVRMTILYNVSDRYFSYLFWDTRTYDRYPYHLEQVNGRWVVAPEDAAYYLYAGAWRSTWTPLAALWWVVEATLLIVLGINKVMGRWQQETLTA